MPWRRPSPASAPSAPPSRPSTPCWPGRSAGSAPSPRPPLLAPRPSEEGRGPSRTRLPLRGGERGPVGAGLVSPLPLAAPAAAAQTLRDHGTIVIVMGAEPNTPIPTLAGFKQNQDVA